MSDAPRLPVARLADAFTCPVCGRIVHGASPRSGEGWYECPRRPCSGHWLNIVLPPGTSAADLIARFGVVATALLTALLPAPTHEHLAATGVFIPHDAASPAHLQILTQPRAEYRWRHAPLVETLRALHGLDAASSRQGAAYHYLGTGASWHRRCTLRRHGPHTTRGTT